MTNAWVVGSRGLLGSAIVRALLRDGIPVFDPGERFLWSDGVALEDQFRSATNKFLKQLSPGDSWQIFWAAGIGSMNSKEADFFPETLALRSLLLHLSLNSDLRNTYGAIILASSAGAIYAGCTDTLITENSLASPTTPYAREKISHENMVYSFCEGTLNTVALIARISTLYGAGQNSTKQQGLLSHISRHILRNQPVHIFVPYDTIRDYLFVDDAVIYIRNSLKSAIGTKQVMTKIISSERPTTIAEIIYIFKRLSRKSPRIITIGGHKNSPYSRRIQFKSIRSPVSDKPHMTSLPVGIHRLMMHERLLYAASHPVILT
jgi:UDP-glucose 4-epimerase